MRWYQKVDDRNIIQELRYYTADKPMLLAHKMQDPLHAQQQTGGLNDAGPSQQQLECGFVWSKWR